MKVLDLWRFSFRPMSPSTCTAGEILRIGLARGAVLILMSLAITAVFSVLALLTVLFGG
jgi:hypothetical protein